MTAVLDGQLRRARRHVQDRTLALVQLRGRLRQRHRRQRHRLHAQPRRLGHRHRRVHALARHRQQQHGPGGGRIGLAGVLEDEVLRLHREVSLRLEPQQVRQRRRRRRRDLLRFDHRPLQRQPDHRAAGTDVLFPQKVAQRLTKRGGVIGGDAGGEDELGGVRAGRAARPGQLARRDPALPDRQAEHLVAAEASHRVCHICRRIRRPHGQRVDDRTV